MNTKINLTYKGVPYVLEYDRMGVKLLEANNFDVSTFMEKPMTNIELVFAGAFVKHHSKISQTLVDEIFNNCKDKSGLTSMLVKMVNETYDALMEEPVTDEGNATWEVMDLSPKTSQK